MTNDSTTAIQLTLYGRNDCHLCEDMLNTLAEFEKTMGFSVKWVDIDKDPTLQTRYSTLVPVLMHNKTEICHYFLDPQALHNYFRQVAE